METASSWSGTMGGDSTEQEPCLSTTAGRDVINTLHSPDLCRPPWPHTCQGIHSVSHRSKVTIFVARSGNVLGSRAGELLRQQAGRCRQQRGNRHRCRHRPHQRSTPELRRASTRVTLRTRDIDTRWSEISAGQMHPLAPE